MVTRPTPEPAYGRYRRPAPAVIALAAFALVLLVPGRPASAGEEEWKGYIQAGAQAIQDRNMDEAKRQFTLALTEAEKFPPNDVRLGATLSQLAAIHATLREVDRAEPMYLRALEILRATRGPTDPTVANAEFNLAQIYAGTGRFADALPLYDRVMAVYTSAYGEESESVLRCLRSSGLCLVRLGRADEAKARLKRALDLSVKRSGPTSAEVAELSEELAKAHALAKDYPASLQSYMRAIMIVERQAQPDPMVLARLYAAMGIVNIEAGNLDDALVLYGQAQELIKATMGDQHITHARLLKAIGAAREAKGELELAQQSYAQALAIEEKTLGQDHLDVGSTLSALADLDVAREQYQQALPRFERALAIAQAKLGPDHELIVVLTTSYARALDEAGQKAKSDELLQQAQAMRRRLDAQRPAEPGR